MKLIFRLNELREVHFAGRGLFVCTYLRIFGGPIDYLPIAASTYARRFKRL